MNDLCVLSYDTLSSCRLVIARQLIQVNDQ